MIIRSVTLRFGLIGLLILVGASAGAAPLVMTPDPLGDWVCLAGHCSASDSTRTLDIVLLSGDTTPVPAIELRMRVRGGGPFAASTVSFLFDFDSAITDGMISSATGNFISPPMVFFAAENRVVEFVCLQAPCDVDVAFELIATPATLEVTDAVNQFVDSPGAPSQKLTANFDADTDSDGIPDNLDNCIESANSSQRDTNSDGFGNVCDADLDNDLMINFPDLNIMFMALFSSPGSPNWNPDADLDGDDMVNFADLALMRLSFFGVPGPSGIAP